MDTQCFRIDINQVAVKTAGGVRACLSWSRMVTAVLLLACMPLVHAGNEAGQADHPAEATVQVQAPGYTEYEAYKEAVVVCLEKHDGQACSVVRKIRAAHRKSEAQLNACRGDQSDACKTIVRDAAISTADAISHAEGAGSDSYRFHLLNGDGARYFYDENALVREMVEETKDDLRKQLSGTAVASGVMHGVLKRTGQMVGLGDNTDHLSRSWISGLFTKEYYQDKLNAQAALYRDMDAEKWGEAIGASIANVLVALLLVIGAVKVVGSMKKVRKELNRQ